MDVHKLNKKIMMFATVVITSLSLTACDSLTLSDLRSYTDNLDNTMLHIIDRNIAIITELYNAGLLDDSQRKIWEQSVREKCAALMDTADIEKIQQANPNETPEKVQERANKTFELFKQAIVEKTTIDKGDDPDTPDEETYTNYNTIKDATAITGRSDNAIPLMLFDDSSVQTFLNDLNRPVYILNTTKMTNGVNDATDLKYMQLALAILKNDATTLDNIIKTEHIAETTNIAGVGTIAELKTNMTNLNQNQQKQLETYVLSFFKKTDSNLASLEADDIFVNSTAHPNLAFGETAYANEINYDVVIASDGLATLTIRVHELNKNLIPFLRGMSTNVDSGGEGLCGNYYLLKTSKIALKLDYKLETISDIYTGSVANHGATTDKTWECKTEQTDYTMSIYDGSMVTEDGKRNKFNENIFNSRSILVHPNNTYKTKIGYVQRYTTGKENIKANEVKSSEIDFNKASTEEEENGVTYTCFYKKDGTKVYAHYNYGDCSTIVLKDYLEYNYFPNVISDENFIATGRRLRVNKLSGGEADIDKFAEAITKTGTSFEITIYISLRNIIDHQSGQEYYEGINEKLGLGQDNASKVNEELAKSSDDRQDKLKSVINSGMLDGAGNPDESQSEKEKASKKLQFDAYFNWIRPVEVFGTKTDVPTGAQNINANDTQQVKDHIVPTVWGMFTSNSLGETLWGSWIMADSDRETGSLAWFTTWLKNNKFTYTITKDMIIDVEEEASSTYSTGGKISLDLDTVAKVQKIQDERYGFNIERVIRTISRVVGMLIMLYGLVLLGAWVIDVNIEGGPGFLKKLTFGKWISIRDTTGLPAMPPDGVYYLNFISLMVSVFIILCLGVVLMVIDIIDIKDIVMGITDNIIEAVRSSLFS